MFLYFVDLLGTAIFAISGVSLAFRLKMDAVGVVVLASVTAIGGGTIRDLILDVPVFWLNNNTTSKYYFSKPLTRSGSVKDKLRYTVLLIHKCINSIPFMYNRRNCRYFLFYWR